MKWTPGRQGTGYEKLLILQCKFPIPFDLYLLRYRPGSFIDWHTDYVKGKRHFRLNIFLKKSKSGGVFETKYPVCFGNRYFQVFRPDINLHRVTEVQGSTRYVLSLGWLSSTTCIECGVDTKPGAGAARCPQCWEDRCGH